MRELPGGESAEPQDDPDYRPPEPEDEIPPQYRYLRELRLEPGLALAMGADGGAVAASPAIALRPIPFRLKVAAYTVAGSWPFAAALLGDSPGAHSFSLWLEPLSLASMGGLYASTGLVRALRRELSPANDTPVRRSTLAALFALFCVLAVTLGVLRGMFISTFGY
jgi:hypothetical protein